MASPHDQPTRVQPAAPQPAAPAAAGPPLDLKTLIITAVASALAAYICSKVWAPGTLASAAFTPVAVAVFREALRKPTEVVTTALPAALPITRRGVATGNPYEATRAPLSDTDPTQVHRGVPGEEPTRVSPGIGPQEPGPVGAEPVTVHAVRDVDKRRRWQIAIGTGLLGFILAAALITVPEVIAGKENTTFFQPGKSSTKAAPVVTTTQQTVTQQITTVPQETVTQTQTVPTTETTETETVTEEAPPTVTGTTPTTETTTTTTPDDGAVDPGVATP
jgi:hypothetical protein